MPAQVQGLFPQTLHTLSPFEQPQPVPPLHPHAPKRLQRPHWQGGSEGFGPQGAQELQAGVPSAAQEQPPRLP